MKLKILKGSMIICILLFFGATCLFAYTFISSESTNTSLTNLGLALAFLSLFIASGIRYSEIVIMEKQIIFESSLFEELEKIQANISGLEKQITLNSYEIKKAIGTLNKSDSNTQTTKKSLLSLNIVTVNEVTPKNINDKQKPQQK